MKNQKVDLFFNNLQQLKDELSLLRQIISSTELVEDYKWGAPTYTINGKNIISIFGFKNYFAIWFFQGVYLNDSNKVLVNAQESKTKALRQWRFHHKNEINNTLILDYIQEAITNHFNGKELKISRKIQFEMPEKLKEELNINKDLKNSFYSLTKGKQKDYANYINDAKQEATKSKRLDKIIPMIKKGIGLNDKYKNC